MSKPLHHDFRISPAVLTRKMKLNGLDDVRLGNLLGVDAYEVRMWRLGRWKIPKYVAAFFVIYDPDEPDRHIEVPELLQRYGNKPQATSRQPKRIKPLLH